MSESLRRQRARHYAHVREISSFLSVAMNSIERVNHQLDETERAGFCHCVAELRRKVDLFNLVNHHLQQGSDRRFSLICNEYNQVVKCKEVGGITTKLKKRGWPSCRLPTS